MAEEVWYCALWALALSGAVIFSGCLPTQRVGAWCSHTWNTGFTEWFALRNGCLCICSAADVQNRSGIEQRRGRNFSVVMAAGSRHQSAASSSSSTADALFNFSTWRFYFFFFFYFFFSTFSPSVVLYIISRTSAGWLSLPLPLFLCLLHPVVYWWTPHPTTNSINIKMTELSCGSLYKRGQMWRSCCGESVLNQAARPSAQQLLNSVQVQRCVSSASRNPKRRVFGAQAVYPCAGAYSNGEG